MVEAISHARSHVHIAGWHLAANFTVQPGDPRLSVRDLLAAVAGRVDVRVVVWAGAPISLISEAIASTGRITRPTESSPPLPPIRSAHPGGQPQNAWPAGFS